MTDILINDESENDFKAKVEYVRNSINEILNIPIGPDNFSTYSSDTINSLIDIYFKNVLPLYRMQYPDVSDEDIQNFTKMDEDKIFESLGLDSLTDIIDQASLLENKIQFTKETISTLQDQSEKVYLLPPDESKIEKSGKGAELRINTDEREVIETIFYMLEEEDCEFDIYIGNETISEDQIRQLPYFAFRMDNLNRIILACNQADNATFIIDTEGLEEVTIDNILNGMTKDHLKELANTGEINLKTINYSKETYKWKMRILNYLSTDLNSNHIDTYDELLGEYKVNHDDIIEVNGKTMAAVRYVENYIRDNNPTMAILLTKAYEKGRTLKIKIREFVMSLEGGEEQVEYQIIKRFYYMDHNKLMRILNEKVDNIFINADLNPDQFSVDLESCEDDSFYIPVHVFTSQINDNESRKRLEAILKHRFNKIDEYPELKKLNSVFNDPLKTAPFGYLKKLLDEIESSQDLDEDTAFKELNGVLYTTNSRELHKKLINDVPMLKYIIPKTVFNTGLTSEEVISLMGEEYHQVLGYNLNCYQKLIISRINEQLEAQNFTYENGKIFEISDETEDNSERVEYIPLSKIKDDNPEFYKLALSVLTRALTPITILTTDKIGIISKVQLEEIEAIAQLPEYNDDGLFENPETGDIYLTGPAYNTHLNLNNRTYFNEYLAEYIPAIEARKPNTLRVYKVYKKLSTSEINKILMEYKNTDLSMISTERE